MEINVNFVLLEEMEEAPNGRAEARIEILRESRNVDFALDSAAPDFDSPE